jgi:hypothetical protein
MIIGMTLAIEPLFLGPGNRKSNAFQEAKKNY